MQLFSADSMVFSKKNWKKIDPEKVPQNPKTPKPQISFLKNKYFKNTVKMDKQKVYPELGV